MTESHDWAERSLDQVLDRHRNESLQDLTEHLGSAELDRKLAEVKTRGGQHGQSGVANQQTPIPKSDTPIVFKPHAPHFAKPDPGRDRAAGVPALPAELLDRHGARVLRPGDHLLAPGAAIPGSTVYRRNRVLLDHRLLENDEQLAQLDVALSMHGLCVDRKRVRRDGSQRAQRAVVGAIDSPNPARADAWQILQTLWTSVNLGRCSQEVAHRVRLEHLLLAASGAGTGDNSGSPSADAIKDAATGLSLPDRVPVDLAVPLPPRRPLSDMPGKRRPLVAVLDTGVASNCLDLEIADRYEQRDAFVEVDFALQQTLSAEADPDAPALDSPWDDQPIQPGSLLGTLASHFGHGTFIAGIIRQVAPDVRVRSIRVMHSDGVVYEHEAVAALTALADEVERARAGDETADPVDVVSLSFGYFDEDSRDQPYGALHAVVDRLTMLGVPVVTAAGDFTGERPFYPAAFAAYPRASSCAPVLSVAALNPNGTVATYSNDGPWVSCYARGTSMVSTFPYYVERSPDLNCVNELETQEGYSPEDFTSGYAVWSGTSFAAPMVAARLAAELVNDPDNGVAAHDVASVIHRMQWAVKTIGGS